MCLLDLTVEAGIPGDVMWPLMGGKNIVSVPCHEGLLVDMVKESIKEDSNYTHVMKIRINM